MDVWSIATAALMGIGGIIASVTTGVIAGRFGVRTAVRQFKMQRGFDRRLEWYEKTMWAVGEFLIFNETIVYALQNQRKDLLKTASERAGEPMNELQKAVRNSLLYSDREMYLRLKEARAKLEESIKATTELLDKGEPPIQQYVSNAYLMRLTLFALSKPIRKMLDLDKLELADFDK
jgi:hypothetical protein